MECLNNVWVQMLRNIKWTIARNTGVCMQKTPSHSCVILCKNGVMRTVASGIRTIVAMIGMYLPEIVLSDELGDELATRFQQMIGILS